jgi:hypothetical protein
LHLAVTPGSQQRGYIRVAITSHEPDSNKNHFPDDPFRVQFAFIRSSGPAKGQL